MAQQLKIVTATGGILSCETDSENGRPYVSWIVGAGWGCGVIENSTSTRDFFRKTLARLEKDAKKAGK